MTSRRLRGAIAIASIVLASLAYARASAASGARVLVVAEDPSSTLVSKLRSELTAGGYDVDLVSAAAATDLSAEAAVRHARAVLRVAPMSDSVDLWIADREGADIRFRERIASATDKDDPSLLAIRAHEAVHGKLLPIAPAEAPERAMPAAATPAVAPQERPAPAPASTRAPPATFAASLGPSLVLSPGGVGATGDVALGFSWLATERLSVDALARIPVVAASIDAPEGRARVGIGALGGGLSFAFAEAAALVRPSLGAGLAFAWTHVDGVATPPFVSHSSDLFAAMPYLRVSTSLRLTGKLRLRADLLGALSIPQQAVTFAGRQVATFGQPLVDGALSLEALW